jgi:hypothetical protein
MGKKIKMAYLSAIAIMITVGFASLSAIAKNDSAKNENSNKTVQSQEKDKDKNTTNNTNQKNNAADLKTYEKPDSAKGETNAQIHKEKTKNVVKNLEQVATEEKSAGNAEFSKKINQAIQEQEQTQEQTANAIEQVENRGKIKTFLIGTDYKNLGQLRSSLVHNRNEIRQLTQALTLAQTEESKAQIQAQLTTLTQERERIKAVITANEDSFSLFGWVVRFLDNYEQKSIDEQEENKLAEEVKDAIINGPTEMKTTDTKTETQIAQ